MKEKVYLVLGAAGFIGQNLCRTLIGTGYGVIGFDRIIPECKIDGVEYVAGDFSDSDQIYPLIDRSDAVFHLVSTTKPSTVGEDVPRGYACDVAGTARLLEYLRNKNKRLIFASSGGTVYGRTTVFPIAETHITKPINHYGLIKVAIENLIKMYNRTSFCDNMILRISNPYGPGQDYTKGVGVVDAFMKQCIRNEPITIYGDGEVIRDFIYIDDVCRSFLAAANYSGEYHTFNICSGVGHSVNDVLRMVQKITGRRDMEVNYIAGRPVDAPKIVLDNTLAREELGFVAEIPMEDGIHMYYDQIIKNKNEA